MSADGRKNVKMLVHAKCQSKSKSALEENLHTFNLDISSVIRSLVKWIVAFCRSANLFLILNWFKTIKNIIIDLFNSRAQSFEMEKEGCSFACSLFTCVFMSREMGQVQLIVDGWLSQREKTRGRKVSAEDVLRSVIKVFHSKWEQPAAYCTAVSWHLASASQLHTTWSFGLNVLFVHRPPWCLSPGWPSSILLCPVP